MQICTVRFGTPSPIASYGITYNNRRSRVAYLTGAHLGSQYRKTGIGLRGLPTFSLETVQSYCGSTAETRSWDLRMNSHYEFVSK
jgi:hypothetical protein